jgi:hypothetical protein
MQWALLSVGHGWCIWVKYELRGWWYSAEIVEFDAAHTKENGPIWSIMQKKVSSLKRCCDMSDFYSNQIAFHISICVYCLIERA